MNKIIPRPKVLAFLTLVIFLSQMGCTKSNDTDNSTTTLTKDLILVQKIWKVDMVDQLVNSTFTKFISGVSNTTGVNYENTRFSFKSEGTGTYTNESGTNHNLTWQFTAADKRTMSVIVNTPVINNSTWEMVEIADNYMHFSVNFTVAGNSNNMETFRLKQIL